MSIDRFLAKSYNANSYHCAHLVVDVWAFIKGEDLTPHLLPTLTPLSQVKTPDNCKVKFKSLSKPKTTCLVLMRGVKRNPHIGVFYEGRVLHLTEGGVRFDRLGTCKTLYQNMRFYLPCKL